MTITKRLTCVKYTIAEKFMQTAEWKDRVRQGAEALAKAKADNHD